MSAFYIVFMSLQLNYVPFCSIETELFYVLTSNVFATTNFIHCYAFLVLYKYMNVAIITTSQFTPLVSTGSTLGLLLNVTGVAERQKDLIPGG